MENNENNEVFTEKILKTLEKYKDNTTSTIARIIGKHCNRESLNNVKKRREIRRKITLNLLKKEDIITKMQTEQRLCLILDNYSVHKIRIHQKNSIISEYYFNIPSTILSTLKSNRTNLETNEKRNKTLLS